MQEIKHRENESEQQIDCSVVWPFSNKEKSEMPDCTPCLKGTKVQIPILLWS